MSKYGKIKNPKLKKAWLADLRSGNFLQAGGSLCMYGTKKTKARYCCLGVLGRTCQRTKLFDVIFKKSDPDDGTRSLEYENKQDSELLPTNLAKEIGITEWGMRKLAKMNDASFFEKGLSFKEIADWIEKYL